MKINYYESDEISNLANAMHAQLKEFGILAERRAECTSEGSIFLYVARPSNVD